MRSKIFVSLCLAALLVSSAAADSVKFPTFGIAFTPPGRATFDLTTSPGCVGLYSFNRESACPGAALCIEWVPAKGASADRMAQSMVHEHGATIAPGSYTIGGEKAVKTSADYAVNSFTRRVTYLVAHGNYIYMVSAFNTATANASKQLEDFLPTVSFFAPDVPLKHLDEMTDAPWSIFGSFSMKFPRCARKFDSTPELFNVGINDLSTTALGQPFSVDIEPIETPTPVTFTAIRDGYSANMAKGLSIPADHPLNWHLENNVPGLNVTDAVKCTVKLPGGRSTSSTVRLAILELSPGNFVQFIFTSDPAQANAYIHLSDAMLKTIKPAPRISN